MQFTLQSIATLLGGTIEGDPQAIVSSFGRIEEAGEGQLTFLANPKYEPHIYTTRATATLVSDDFRPSAPLSTNLIRVADPYAALAQLMQLATEEMAPRYEGVASEAYIHPSVKLPKHRCFFCLHCRGSYLRRGLLYLSPHLYRQRLQDRGRKYTLSPGDHLPGMRDRRTLYPTRRSRNRG